MKLIHLPVSIQNYFTIKTGFVLETCENFSLKSEIESII